MAKHIAITIAGAVSLGSYESGVMYEMLEALRIHNEKAEAAGTPDTKIYVDVITGASAGGMTAAVLGQWLMFAGDAFSDAAKNPLYHAWVERVSLKGLVRLQRGENKWHSLFSSDLVSEIGKEMLMDPMVPPKPLSPHPCIAVDSSRKPEALRIGVALSNLNGIDYMIPIVGSDEGGFNYTRSVDQQLFTVRDDGLMRLIPDGTETPSEWKQLRDAAVASGAFPFAFRPRGVSRSQTEFVNQETPLWPGKGRPTKEGTTYVQWGPDEPCDFAYTDGGVLQNQPLGIAKDLVNMAVQERLHRAQKLPAAELADKAVRESYQDADNRLYMFISPNAVKSSSVTLVADKISLGQMVPAILHTYLRQSTFHDWIMAERANQKVRLLDERAKELAAALNAGELKAGTLQAASAELNDLLLRGDVAGPLRRLQSQYAKLYNSVLAGSGEPAAKAFISALATLEAAARLSDTDKMKIVAVLADGKKELAGSGISSFVGFFSRKFREHDYLVGRVKAREYLQRKDVLNILSINLPAIQEYWKQKPLADPTKMLTVPLDWWTMLRPGIGWLLWLVLIRIWKPGIAIVVLIVAIVAAYHYL
jgi:predicted acylesterase/phospholipase RssA